MNLNEIKYGFKLLSIKEIEDIGATLYQYEHIKSGGLVVYLACEDTNCCAGFGFRTLPEDSTGVCHIIEHSLLCGSKKYPLKEPFVNLLKGSLATFLNAFTAYDWTMYPFASQTPKDFDNILKVYADAVFNPLSIIDNKPFLQEGWHLELLNEDDTPSYKGVVYNEMKGAMSSVDEVLVQTTLEAMYKDTPYRFNSGGDPDVIPTLTFEAYKAFYKKHYTPQNCMTYFYGKLDIEEKLKFLDEEYFNKFDRTDDIIVIEPQKPLIDLNYQKEYEIGADESEKDNTYMSLCYGLDNYNNYEEYLAMNILCEALLADNESPLKKALLDAKLGQNIECRIDDDNIIPALHIYLQKSNPNKKEAFKEVFESEVAKLVKYGIDKELLLATINHNEFKDKEADMGRMPKGLLYAMTLMGSFNYYGDLSSHLEFSKYYKKYKEELNNNYFENLLDKYILQSKHNVEVVITPSKTLGQKKKETMDKQMEALKNTLTLKEKKELVKQTKELLAYQNHVDTKEELKTLPSLKVKDIPGTINYLDSKKVTINGMKGIYHILNTNKIGYLRMYFDANKVAYEDLPYVLLMKNLLLNVNTKNYSTLDLNKKIKTFLGDLSFSELATNKKEEAKVYVKISASALKENINYIPEYINEVVLNSKFTKKETLQILKQMTNDLRQNIIGNGMRIAMTEAKSAYSKYAKVTCDCLAGVELYNFLNNLVNNFNFVQIKNKLNEVGKEIFAKKNVFFSISGDDDTVECMKNAVKNIKLSSGRNLDEKLVIELAKPTNDAIIIPSGVSYNAIGTSFKDLGYEYDGKYIVISHIIQYDYLWNEIRVKGGAYGSNISILNDDNSLALGTYRDPNVKNSYEKFAEIGDYLRNFKVSKDLFNTYLIGALGGFDSPGSNTSLINQWDLNYLCDRSKKTILEIKKQALNTKAKDINEAASLFDKAAKANRKYTIGNDTKVKEYQFDEVKPL